MEFSEVGVEAADNRRQPDPHDGAAEGNRAESVCEGREARPLSFPMSRDKNRRFMQGGPSRRLVCADRGPVLAVGRVCERQTVEWAPRTSCLAGQAARDAARQTPTTPLQFRSAGAGVSVELVTSRRRGRL